MACEPNPATRVKVPNAMRIKGYSPSKASNRVLQMQVRREAEKTKGEAGPGPPAPAAASLVLALVSVATTTVNSKTQVFLSPATQHFHDSIAKATKLSEVVYNTRKSKEVQKFIIESIDHILNHNLVCGIPVAANLIGMVEGSMQKIKEEFNKVVLSILGSNIGKDSEVCFPSYKNK